MFDFATAGWLTQALAQATFDEHRLSRGREKKGAKQWNMKELLFQFLFVFRLATLFARQIRMVYARNAYFASWVSIETKVLCHILDCAELVKYAVNPQYLWVADKNWKIELNQMSKCVTKRVGNWPKKKRDQKMEGGCKRQWKRNPSQDKNNKALKPKRKCWLEWWRAYEQFFVFSFSLFCFIWPLFGFCSAFSVNFFSTLGPAFFPAVLWFLSQWMGIRPTIQYMKNVME